MTVGVSTVNTADVWLNYLRGTAPGAIASLNIKLHTADPGASGATAASVVTTRQVLTFSASASGALALSNSPTFTMTGTETISHISVWSDIAAGNFLFSAALTVPKSVVNTDTLTFTAVAVSITPLAA